jgi:LacI family transcriptional regulator
MLRGIGETAEQKGYRLLLHSLWRDGERSLDPLAAMAEHHVDGVLCFEPGQAPDAGLLAGLSTPMVLVNYASSSLPSVSSANRDGAREAVRHLLGLGHRRIGLLRGPSGHQAADERWQGWRDALAGAGIAPEAGWVSEAPFSGYAGLTTAAEEAAANRLLDQAGGLSAVFASSDLMALGLYRSAQAKGLRIPDDLSVIAFDDSWVGRSCQPALSCVRQDPYKMGAAATELLLRMLAKGAPAPAGQAAQVVVPVSLALRRSTAKPPLA